MKRILIILGIVAFMLLALAIMAKSFGWINRETGTKVAVEQAEKKELIGMVSATGKIYPEAEIKISPEVPGEIIELYVEEGDSVKAGQILLKIRPDDYQTAIDRSLSTLNNTKANVAQAEAGIAQAQAQLAQAKARVTQAEAGLKNAQTEYNRNLKLFNEELIAERDLSSSELQVNNAKAELESAKQAVRSAQESINSSKATKRATEYTVQSVRTDVQQAKNSYQKTIIRAPQSGIISKLDVEKGERVVGTSQMAGTEMLTIANLANMEVRVEVSEIDIARVEIGDTCEIEVDAYYDKLFKGVVTNISNSLKNGVQQTTNDQVTNFLVTVNILPESYTDLQDKKFPFRPGMSASVDIITEQENEKVAIPIQAVTAKTMKDYLKMIDDSTHVSADDKQLHEFVYKVKENKPIISPVKTGFQDNENIIIEEGVAIGDSIIIAPFSVISNKLSKDDELIIVDKDKVYEN